MKLWKALEIAIKELKVEFKGVKRKYRIIIEDDPWVEITKIGNNDYYEVKFGFDIRDWDKIKNAVDSLLAKELKE